MSRQESSVDLPKEVIVEILLRLPVKSLLRFRCVSKSWLSLISSPRFRELHFQGPSKHSHRVFVSAQQRFQSIDFDAPFHDDSAIVKFNFPRPTTPANLKIMGSCRGFLFLVADKKQKHFLWNPSNGVCRKIPPLDPDIFVYMYGFAYDESTDDYIIVIISDFLAFFSLKANSWEILDDECEYTYQIDQPTPGSILNGAIHWFALCSREPEPECFTIIAFDIKSKTLREIPVPDDFEYGLGILGSVAGCLTLTENCNVLKMWVTEKYGVESSWRNLGTLSPNEVHMEAISPLCFTKDGHLVAINSILGLAKLNHRGKLLEYRKFLPEPHAFYCASVYTEALLSLPSVSCDHLEEAED
ncbi:hypothetical protein QN277_000538 [Acacia crassicarpa]|uniref:F-box domain-containing protein n=1 Tax=Acacia crassicarpa TaxID=499986 RepID=A0AAE1N598_9FABA|nr:hypothetical protein QN277_000538 [Acacia crassicarpa]